MDIDEIFHFKLNNKSTAYYIVDYRQTNNPDITELVLPSEFRGLPVIRINYRAFASSRYLISVKIPSSIRNIEELAFADCSKLESVEFPDAKTYIEEDTFYGCTKLPAEIQLMSVLGSTNLACPMSGVMYHRFAPKYRSELILEKEPFMRTDIFELAVRNKCFRTSEGDWLLWMLETLVERCTITHMQIAADGGLLDDEDTLVRLADISAKKGDVELTAWLLEYKNRKFGFNGGDNYEL